MAIVITELAIQSDGTFAIELTNTDNTNSADISDLEIAVFNDGTGTSLGVSLFGAPTSIAAGGTITIGHNSISGVDYSVAGTANSLFEGPVIDQVVVGDNPTTGGVDDLIGQFFGADLGTDIVYEANTDRTGDTDFFGASNVSDFTVTNGFSNNTLGTAVCFAPGTLISTPGGERVVETLKVGDLVRTVDGRDVPVLWLGKQTLTRHLGMLPEDMQHVRIKAGALGQGLPHSDLTVTADHGMILDGFVVNASALINGDCIDWVPMKELPKTTVVYHIETAVHEEILANGAPTETFIDYVGRKAFDNYDEYLARHGAERIIPETSKPRISTARLLPMSIKRRLGIAPPPLATDMTRLA